ncbi:class I SAM-dependent methyltransferase [Variovorax sp. dw_954]|uniref:class I SAM-dependent methyltransferase n=1 Tax=Variovorax sp. dw_954 TaxID=2720078 RepID=UPI001BD4077D|nr:class I SAM-dependent methyltransferase [Variovorax sp. dw_954]
MPIYEAYFDALRSDSISLFEIGVQNGGSLESHAAYFPNAKCIIGCDINPDCRNLEFREENIHVVVGDAGAPATKQEILDICGSFDFIIDDGSHKSDDIVRNFSLYFPCLKANGIFIIEDLHCSYWQDFGGGLHNEKSAQSFLKLLADIINFEHWGVAKTRRQFIDEAFPGVLSDDAEEWLASIYSVQFFNSVCVIRKAETSRVTLGERIIAGADEAITKDFKKYNGTGPLSFAQDGNPFARFHAWRDELGAVEKKLEEVEHARRNELGAAEKKLEEAQHAWRDELSAVDKKLEEVQHKLKKSMDELASSEQECEKLQGYVSGFRRRLIARDQEVISRFKVFDKELEDKDQLVVDLCRRAMDIPPPAAHWWEAVLSRLGLKRLSRAMFPAGRTRLLEEIQLIRKSGRFDPVYYLTKHPEALEERGNPIAHYLTVGWRSGYDPSADFDGAGYTRTQAIPIHQAPLLHALLSDKA